MAKVTYRVVHKHIGGDLDYGRDFLELVPTKEFETIQEAAAECIRLRDRMVEKSLEQYKKIAIVGGHSSEWSYQATVEWGNRGDLDIFETCMFGYSRYD